MEPFIGQISLFGFNFAPRGWAFCHGQLLAIAQNTALFSLLGTQYGGNGTTTFGLPDLRGRVPLGFGPGPGLTPRTIGEIGGIESVTLISSQIPAHNHPIYVSGDAGTTDSANGNFLANGAVTIARGNTIPANLYGATSSAQLNPNSVGMTGGNIAHQNMQPYLVMNYCIAIQGVFPSRN